MGYLNKILYKKLLKAKSRTNLPDFTVSISLPGYISESQCQNPIYMRCQLRPDGRGQDSSCFFTDIQKLMSKILNDLKIFWPDNLRLSFHNVIGQMSPRAGVKNIHQVKYLYPKFIINGQGLFTPQDPNLAKSSGSCFVKLVLGIEMEVWWSCEGGVVVLEKGGVVVQYRRSGGLVRRCGGLVKEVYWSSTGGVVFQFKEVWWSSLRRCGSLVQGGVMVMVQWLESLPLDHPS